MSAEKIKTMVVEDDPAALEALKMHLQRFEEIELSGCAVNGNEAYNLAMNDKPELIFLDVELPGKSGIEFLDMILREGLRPTVIFTTAYQDYAIEAIRHSAFDYLLKPIDPAELEHALARFKQQRARKDFENDLHQLVSRLKSPRALKFNSKKGFVMIDPEEIIYCEADWNYTDIFYSNGDKELVTLNLGKVEEMLPAGTFVRVSRSILINVSYITRVEKKNHLCILKKNGREYLIKLSASNLRKLEGAVGRKEAGSN